MKSDNKWGKMAGYCNRFEKMVEEFKENIETDLLAEIAEEYASEKISFEEFDKREKEIFEMERKLDEAFEKIDRTCADYVFPE